MKFPDEMLHHGVHRYYIMKSKGENDIMESTGECYIIGSTGVASWRPHIVKSKRCVLHHGVHRYYIMASTGDLP